MFDQDIHHCHKTPEMEPNYPVSYWVLGQSYACKGSYREALPNLDKFSALSRGGAASLALVGYAHARLGERSQALRRLEDLQAASKQTFVSAFFFALVYVCLEACCKSFMWLEIACYDA